MQNICPSGHYKSGQKKKVVSATLAYTEKTRRWKDEVMERVKAVYHSTPSPLVEDLEHSGTAEDYIPTHDLSLKKVQCKVLKSNRKVRVEAGIWHSSTPTPNLKLQDRLIAMSQC